MPNYTGKLLNLDSKFLYVAFYEEATKKLMGKVINTQTGNSWKPGNLTTAMLLYLLCREDQDDIPYEMFKQLITAKFDGVSDDKIDAVLDFLDQRGALDLNGTNATRVPDPLKLFTGPKLTWEGKDFNPAGNVHCKGHHVHSSGYVMITIWK
jgi:hypothetical protein